MGVTSRPRPKVVDSRSLSRRPPMIDRPPLSAPSLTGRPQHRFRMFRLWSDLLLPDHVLRHIPQRKIPQRKPALWIIQAAAKTRTSSDSTTSSGIRWKWKLHRLGGNSVNDVFLVKHAACLAVPAPNAVTQGDRACLRASMPAASALALRRSNRDNTRRAAATDHRRRAWKRLGGPVRVSRDAVSRR
jgi:hypothetical protein